MRHDRADAEQASCTAVAQFLGGNPWHKPGFVVREVLNPRPSGNVTLDAATRLLAAALRADDDAEANLAESRVSSVCSALGMWQPRH